MPKTAETVVEGAAASPGSTASDQPNDTSASPSSVTPPAEATDESPEAATVDARPSVSDEGDEDALLTDAEFEELQNDPAALRASLQKAYTQKTQKLGPARQLLAALQKDPDAVIQALADARGIGLSKGTPAADAASAVGDDLHKMFAEALGPESAKVFLPALDKLIAKHLDPLKKSHEEAQVRAAAEHAKVIESTFTKMRPDWKKYEKAMIQLSNKITPRGLEPVAYLDLLYVAASNDNAAMKIAQGLVDRITKSAEAVAESKVSSAGASTTQVASTSSKRPSIREAAQMALRGERAS